MNMKVNLDASVNNLLYMDYMEKQQQIDNTKSNEDQNDSCCRQTAPRDKKENHSHKIL